MTTILAYLTFFEQLTFHLSKSKVLKDLLLILYAKGNVWKTESS